MVNYLLDLNIDRISFWFGFTAGLLFVLLLYIFRKFLPRLVQSTKQQLRDTLSRITESTDVRFRNNIVRYTQQLHLTSMFFSLDEVALEPRLITPHSQHIFHKNPQAIDAVHQMLPYIPDWPELAATYHAPTISLVQALQKNANIVILGHPGSGKTFSLAWLASGIARKDTLMGSLGEYLPVYIHAADLPISNELIETQSPTNNSNELSPPARRTTTRNSSNNDQDLLETLLDIISRYTPNLRISQLRSLLTKSINNKRVLLIIDGLDELSQSQHYQATKYLSHFLIAYPDTRIVAAASFDYIGNILSLGLIPLAMASWGYDYKEQLTEKWDHLWMKLIPPSNQESHEQHSLFITNWLQSKTNHATPFEFTLLLWAAYSNEITSSNLPGLLENYLTITTQGKRDLRHNLEILAWQMIENQCLRTSQSNVNRWTSHRSIKKATQSWTPDHNIHHPGDRTISRSRGRLPIRSLSNDGILFQQLGSQIIFSHPIITCYLASCHLSKFSELTPLVNQPNWIGKTLALKFLAYHKDISSIVEPLLNNNNILSQELLQITRWLPLTPNTSSWRSKVLRILVNTINETESVTLRAKLIVAIALSGEQGASILFRQMMLSGKGHIRNLAALGLGLIRDTKAVGDLSKQLENKDALLARSACLALIEIGGQNALDKVINTLLHGSEISRIIAAESLANDNNLGHKLLVDASKSDDLLVRRSAVFGMMRIQQAWAIKILESMQLEDKEWVVRNAAVHALEQIHQPNPLIPLPIPPASEMYWIVEYAGRKGIGVPAGMQAISIIPDLLDSGTDNERLAALEYLGITGNSDMLSKIIQLYSGSSEEIRESAYQTLWLLSLTGTKFTSPK